MYIHTYINMECGRSSWPKSRGQPLHHSIRKPADAYRHVHVYIPMYIHMHMQAAENPRMHIDTYICTYIFFFCIYRADGMVQRLTKYRDYARTQVLSMCMCVCVSVCLPVCNVYMCVYMSLYVQI